MIDLINKIINTINDFDLKDERAINKLSTTLSDLSKIHDSFERKFR